LAQLSYHIDIHYVLPRALFARAETGALLAWAGLRAEAPENTLALFRDPATAAALQAAPVWVRSAFEAAGFGVTPSGQVGPAGRIDANAELHLIQKLTRLRSALEAKGAAEARFEGGLDLGQLFKEAAQTPEPVAPPAPVVDPAPSARPERKADHGRGRRALVFFATAVAVMALVQVGAMAVP